MSLRLALVGCGTIARRVHLPAFRRLGTERADLVAFSSRSRVSAEATAAEWGSGAVVEDWRAVIERPDVDAVDICCPNGLHAEVAIAAARAGKHVLVEKPMAVTVAEADEMIRAATDAGVVLSVAHNLRYAPAYRTVREVVRSGRIGRVVGFRTAFGHSGPQDWAPEADWFHDPLRAGGGALIDLGVHVADLLRFVLDDEAVEAAAMLAWRVPGIDEAAQVVLNMRSGAIGSLHASWVARPGPDRQLTLFGSDGTVHAPSLSDVELRSADGVVQSVDLERPAGSPYRDFVDACQGIPGAHVTGAEGRAALAVVEAAYRSARSHAFAAVE
ncbi:MAG TPA: Gfo/Idh/MocA family oxidoreductase [Acidimicrobiales bacterium]|nr:Gfo/Idh/MocA family oxidoreductase [Acidimicrobiales bacterium]